MEIKNSLDKKNKQLIVFNDALEYYDKAYDINDETTLEYSELNDTRMLLRDQMLVELDNLKDIIGNHPDLKIASLNKEERELLEQFLEYYSICPICHQKNHIYSLKKLYFNEDKKIIKDLIKLIFFNNKKASKFNLKFGIACCNCFQRYFMQE